MLSNCASSDFEFAGVKNPQLQKFILIALALAYQT